MSKRLIITILSVFFVINSSLTVYAEDPVPEIQPEQETVETVSEENASEETEIQSEEPDVSAEETETDVPADEEAEEVSVPEEDTETVSDPVETVTEEETESDPAETVTDEETDPVLEPAETITEEESETVTDPVEEITEEETDPASEPEEDDDTSASEDGEPEEEEQVTDEELQEMTLLAGAPTDLNKFTYEETEGGYRITKYTGSDSVVVIPAKINNKPVVEIGEYAFAANSSMTEAVLPDGIKTIEPAAFGNCTNLSKVTLPNRLETISGSAFHQDKKLTSVNLPAGLKMIDRYAFSYCESLRIPLPLPSGLQELYMNAFENTTNESSITPPKGMTEIAPGHYMRDFEVFELTGEFSYTKAYEVLDLVNKERAKEGFSPLTMDKDLLEAAMFRAAETAVYFDHTRPIGTDCFTASAKMFGENIAAGLVTATATMKQWMNSQGHRRNIMSPGYQSIGIGVFKNERGRWCWVQCFGCDEADPAGQPSDVKKTVKVNASKELVQFELRPEKKTISVGEEAGITVFSVSEEYTSSKIDNSSFNWISSDAGIAEVNAKGTVKAVKSGAVTITAVNKNDPSAKTSIQLTVNYDPVVAFVTRLYKLCLNRDPDQGGLKDWVNQLKTGNKNAAQVVYGFFFSDEMKRLKLSDKDYVERCYAVMMDRASDAGGKQYWVEHLENGVTRLYVVRGFVESQEFTKICKDYGVTRGSLKLTDPRDQNYGITSFVARCYTKALGRKYDEGGLKNWVNQILYASNKKQAAIDSASTGFFHSTEFKNKKLNNTEYVKVLYRTFLGREYDEPGLKDWVGQLNRGTSRDKVMNGFAYSQEFNKIMASYGIR